MLVKLRIASFFVSIFITIPCFAQSSGYLGGMTGQPGGGSTSGMTGQPGGGSTSGTTGYTGNPNNGQAVCKLYNKTSATSDKDFSWTTNTFIDVAGSKQSVGSIINVKSTYQTWTTASATACVPAQQSVENGNLLYDVDLECVAQISQTVKNEYQSKYTVGTGLTLDFILVKAGSNGSANWGSGESKSHELGTSRTVKMQVGKGTPVAALLGMCAAALHAHIGPLEADMIDMMKNTWEFLAGASHACQADKDCGRRGIAMQCAQMGAFGTVPLGLCRQFAREGGRCCGNLDQMPNCGTDGISRSEWPCGHGLVCSAIAPRVCKRTP